MTNETHEARHSKQGLTLISVELSTGPKRPGLSVY